MGRTPNVPGHPGYFVFTDGVIASMDASGETVPAPRFVGDGVVGEKGVVYVLLSDTPPVSVRMHNIRQMGKPYMAAQLIAHAFGAPEGYCPGFYDANPQNLSLSNLMMPDEADKAVYAGRPEAENTMVKAAGGKHLYHGHKRGPKARKECPVCGKFIHINRMKPHIQANHPEYALAQHRGEVRQGATT